MFIKGSLLALLAASVFADDHPITNPSPNTNPSPDNSDYDNGDNTVSSPPRRRYGGGGKPTPVAGSAWGGGRARARTGRIRAKAGRRRRRRWGRPANWVRPVDNDWAKPSESESWDVAPDYEPSEPDWVSPSTDSPTISPTEGDPVCDKVRSYYLYSSLLSESNCFAYAHLYLPHL